LLCLLQEDEFASDGSYWRNLPITIRFCCHLYAPGSKSLRAACRPSKFPWCFNTKQAQNGISRPFRACGAVDAALRQRNFRMNRELSGEPRWNRTLLGVSFEIVDGARLLALRACFTAAYGKVPMLSSAPGSSRIPPGLGDILETRGVLNP
jgi:hypothetical protein